VLQLTVMNIMNRGLCYNGQQSINTYWGCH